MLLGVTLVVLLQAAATQPGASAPVRNPAYTRDGRLAVSVRGDLWLVSPSGQWTPLTTGPAWDREPAWTSDGSAIVFSSDRSGTFAIWRVPVGAAGAAGERQRLTSSSLAESEPAVARDGRVFFVRGRSGAATLWVRDAKGVESRVTKDRAVERWPAVSAAGNRLPSGRAT